MRRFARQSHPDPLSRAESDAAALLSGRAPPDARRLLDLIHTINPTGRHLSAVVRDRRYALKARLQSLLIRHFGDELRVESDPLVPAVVILRARYLGGDACHAKLAALDDDARAWVRFQQDTADSEPPPMRPADPDPPPRNVDPLAQARAARVALDYAAARELFELALETPRGVPAAAELLALLVDDLGDDLAALALVPHLSREVLARPDARRRLALAAARQGDRKRAQAWAHRLAPEQLDEIDAALAREALARDDEPAARSSIAEIAARGATAGLVATLEVELERAAARLRGPLEATLLAAFERGDTAAAEVQARAIVARWPASEPARKVLRVLRDRARAEEVRARLAAFETALATGNLAAARSALAAARAGGADTQELTGRLVRAETEAAARAMADRTEAVVVTLARGELRDGLIDYLALANRAREQVRARVACEVLARVDEVATAVPRARPAVCVDAALALARAAASLDAGAADRAAADLAPHARVLANVPSAIALTHRLHALRDAARARDTAAALDLVQRALDDDDLVTARRRLTALGERALDAAGRARAEQLATRLAHADEFAFRATRAAQAEAARDWAAAIEHADWLLRRAASDGVRDRWAAARTRYRAELRAAWAVWIVEGDAAHAHVLSEYVQAHSREMWLDPSGTELIATSSAGRLLVFAVFDVATARVRRTVMMRPPMDLWRFWSAVVGDEIWLASAEGYVLCVSRTTWDVLHFRPLDELLGAEVTPRLARFAPDGAHLWLETRSERHGDGAVVIDLRNWMRVVQRKGEFWTQMVPGEPERVAYAVELERQVAELSRADGTVVARVQLPKDTVTSSPTCDPNGRGPLLVYLPSARDGGEGYDEPALHMLGPDGTTERVLVLAPTCAAESVAVATSLDAQCVFARYREPEGEWKLVAFGVRDGTFVELYRVTAPADLLLASDAGGRHVVALAQGEDRLDVLRLEATPPARALRGSRVEIGFVPCDTQPPFSCCRGRENKIPPRSRALYDQLARMTPEEIARWTAAKKDTDLDQRGVTAAMLDLVARGDRVAARALATAAKARYPTVFVVALGIAHVHAYDGAWAAMRDAFAGTEPTDGMWKHGHHLLGVAHYWLGDFDAARAAWERGQKIKGACDLEQCLSLAEGADPARPAAEGAALQIRRLLDAVRAADACLARGDMDGAVAVLDAPPTYFVCELQSLARLAYAHLERTPRDEHEAFRRLLVVSLCDWLSSEPEVVPFPGSLLRDAPWPRERIEALLVRARAWLAAGAWRG